MRRDRSKLGAVLPGELGEKPERFAAHQEVLLREPAIVTFKTIGV